MYTFFKYILCKKCVDVYGSKYSGIYMHLYLYGLSLEEYTRNWQE